MDIKNLKINNSIFQRIKKKISKPFKIVRNFIIGTITISGLIYGIHSVDVHNQIRAVQYNEEDINQIVDYYKEKDNLTIVALNDSQGINLNFCFWENSFPEYTQEALTCDELNPYLANISSFKFNKTYHIDKLLSENLSIEEIKEINIAGAKKSFNQVSDDLNIPIKLGMFATLLCDKVNENDDSIKITNIMQNSTEPIILYFSGANDLMRQLHNHPAAMKKYDKDGNIQEGYLYSLTKAEDPKTLDIVMQGIENNFKNILAINPNSRVFAYSIYIPKSLNDENFLPFINIINKYNIELEKLCNKYGVIYISNEALGKIYTNENELGFHINEVGHKVLAGITLKIIAESINNKKHYSDEYNYDFNPSDEGLTGFRDSLLDDANNVKVEEYLDFNKDYLEDIQNDRQEELEGEAEIIDNVMNQLIKKHR